MKITKLLQVHRYFVFCCNFDGLTGHVSCLLVGRIFNKNQQSILKSWRKITFLYTYSISDELTDRRTDENNNSEALLLKTEKTIWKQCKY